MGQNISVHDSSQAVNSVNFSLTICIRILDRQPQPRTVGTQDQRHLQSAQQSIPLQDEMYLGYDTNNDKQFIPPPSSKRLKFVVHIFHKKKKNFPTTHNFNYFYYYIQCFFPFYLLSDCSRYTGGGAMQHNPEMLCQNTSRLQLENSGRQLDQLYSACNIGDSYSDVKGPWKQQQQLHQQIPVSSQRSQSTGLTEYEESLQRLSKMKLLIIPQKKTNF